MVDLVVVVADDIDQLLEAIVILVREATIVDDVMVVKELLLVLEIVDDAIVDLVLGHVILLKHEHVNLDAIVVKKLHLVLLDVIVGVMVVKELLLVLEIVDDAIVDVKLLLVFLEIQTLDLQVDHHDLKVRHLRLVLIADQAREIGSIQKESKNQDQTSWFFYHHLICRPNLLHYR
jgi:hypothetical protein